MLCEFGWDGVAPSPTSRCCCGRFSWASPGSPLPAWRSAGVYSLPHRSAENLETGVKVAIKKIANVFGPEADVVDAKRILREIKLMRHFNHENVRAAA